MKNNAVALLNRIDRSIAEEVAKNIGAVLPQENLEVKSVKKSPALSMANTIKKPDTRCVAILLNGEPDSAQLLQWVQALAANKVNFSIVDKHLRTIDGELKVTDTYDTADASLFDAALLISTSTKLETKAIEFIEMTFNHYKPLGISINDYAALEKSRITINEPGIFDLAKNTINDFITGIAEARFWNRTV